MKSNCEELIDIINVFEGDMDSTGQGWCDAGADMCEDVFGKFTEMDWNELQRKFLSYNDEWKYMFIYALGLVSHEKSAPFLAELVKSSCDKVWEEAFIDLSNIYKGNATIIKKLNLTKSDAKEIYIKCSIDNPKYYHPKDNNIVNFLSYINERT